MKTLFFYTVILFSMVSSTLAQSLKNDSLKVWGNCGMCKTTIEKAAKKAGAVNADWNEDTKQLLVSYNANKTSAVKIQQNIAKSGYDTPDFTGDQLAYEKLHSCCQYQRKAVTKDAGGKKCCGSSSCKGQDDHNACLDKASCKHGLCGKAGN